MDVIASTPEIVAQVYATTRERVGSTRARAGRPLTLTEKALVGHLADPAAELAPGRAYLQLRPDRVAMQDATAQMALLRFMAAGRARVAVPTTVHADHLVRAQRGAERDLGVALDENGEVYDFLASACARFGIGYWQPGSGIIHQVVLEHYAFPGGLLVGADSHTPNAGGLGMLAFGVGGADAVDVMAGFSWEVLQPRLVGVRLTGELSGWCSPKDVILHLLGQLSVAGGTNRILEYFGPGTRTMSCTGKATIANMGAELGATSSIFPFDERMAAYLRGTGREELARLAEANRELLVADPEVEAHPERFYERVIDVDLSSLAPLLVGPHSPDLARPVAGMAAAVAREGYPDTITAALIGSCCNSSYEDLSRAVDVARQALAHGVKARCPLLLSPASEQLRATAVRDGILRDLEAIGAVGLASACGPCIGQWKRSDVPAGERTSIVTTFNRNFRARNDGNPETAAFIGSPEVVVAYALAGRLSWNPLTDTLPDRDGKPFKLQPPGRAPELPAGGFTGGSAGFVPPAADGSAIEVVIRPRSARLQRLTRFPAWDGQDFVELPVLVKARGKCTTDHISPAGKWLKYRGHLDKISDNLFLGAQNAFTGEPGTGINVLTGEQRPLPALAREYKAHGLRWVVVGDTNYGEGSSREQAAMSPRYLGAAAVIVRSFARIHETNLKKQGILPLTFASPADYDRIGERTRVSLLGLASLAPGQPVTARLTQPDGRTQDITLRHTLTTEQIAWFRAGSAL